MRVRRWTRCMPRRRGGPVVRPRRRLGHRARHGSRPQRHSGWPGPARTASTFIGACAGPSAHPPALLRAAAGGRRAAGVHGAARHAARAQVTARRWPPGVPCGTGTSASSCPLRGVCAGGESVGVVPGLMLLPKMRRSTMAAQGWGAVKVLVQPSHGSLAAMATCGTGVRVSPRHGGGAGPALSAALTPRQPPLPCSLSTSTMRSEGTRPRPGHSGACGSILACEGGFPLGRRPQPGGHWCHSGSRVRAPRRPGGLSGRVSPRSRPASSRRGSRAPGTSWAGHNMIAAQLASVRPRAG